ncbi:MAG: DNA polymerase Y family protein, partial [Gammaproteobacteria bacterium]|nr:DNA polymerase Y family protein [Gammaproteobacteria bacterium]
MLWLAVLLPTFSLEVSYRGEVVGGPLAVVGGRGAARRVWACNGNARNYGVHAGMGLAAAYALAPNLRVAARDEELETVALDNLAAWAGRFTSQVSTVSRQGLLLEVGGSLKLFDGGESLRNQLRQGLVELGYAARMAAAPTAMGAWLLVRGGRETWIEDTHKLHAALISLPLASLELAGSKRKLMLGMGLNSLGDLLRVGRGGFVRRFGSDILDCLDRALGRVADPRVPYVPPATFNGRIALSSEVTDREALLFPLHRLLLELGGYLTAVSGGVQRARLTLRQSWHPAIRLPLELMSPTRDTGYLLELIREHLGHIALAAPVIQVEFDSGEILSLPPRTLDLFGDNRPESGGWERLVQRLSARLGTGAIMGVYPVADHRPEQAWVKGRPGGIEADGGAAVRRPLWLLEEPKRLKVVGESPCFHGLLTLRQGPERIESGWWDDHGVSRDYYVAVNPVGET